MQTNNNVTVTTQAHKLLVNAYPRALSYGDIFKTIFPGSPDDRLNQQGGTYLRTLCKKGLARKITTGFYCAVPQR